MEVRSQGWQSVLAGDSSRSFHYDKITPISSDKTESHDFCMAELILCPGCPDRINPAVNLDRSVPEPSEGNKLAARVK